MPVRSANTRQARCSCTSGPAPWNPCHHLGDIDAVVPEPDHGLEPTHRDDAGVHIDPGVRVDKGLTTFTMNFSKNAMGVSAVSTSLDEVDGVLPSPPFQDVAVGGHGDLASASHRRVEPSMSVNKTSPPPKEQPPGQRTPPQNLTRDKLLPGTSPESDPGVSPKHTQRQRATSHASSMSSSSAYTDRSTSRIPSATVVIPSVPTASVPAPIIVRAIPTTMRSTRSVSVPAARSRARAAKDDAAGAGRDDVDAHPALVQGGPAAGRRAPQALALQRRFVADAPHDLRAPLTVLPTRGADVGPTCSQQRCGQHPAGGECVGGRHPAARRHRRRPAGVGDNEGRRNSPGPGRPCGSGEMRAGQYGRLCPYGGVTMGSTRTAQPR